MASATECPTRLHNGRVRVARTAINIRIPLGETRQEENEELKQRYGRRWAHSTENCNPCWTAEPLKSHRFVLLPPEKGASALMDKKTQSVHD